MVDRRPHWNMHIAASHYSPSCCTVTDIFSTSQVRLRLTTNKWSIYRSIIWFILLFKLVLYFLLCHRHLRLQSAAPLVANSLQSGRFWAKLAASVHDSLWASRSFYTVLMQDICGRPSSLIQSTESKEVKICLCLCLAMMLIMQLSSVWKLYLCVLYNSEEIVNNSWIYIAYKEKCDTSNALYVLVLWKQPSFKQTSETVSAKCQIMQIITQCVPGSWTGNSKCLTPIRARVAKVRVSSIKKWAYSMFPAYLVKARKSSFNTQNLMLVLYHSSLWCKDIIKFSSLCTDVWHSSLLVLNMVVKLTSFLHHK